MYLDGISRIGVLDINHGGLLLAKELYNMGFEAFAVDIYGTRKNVETDVPVLKPEDVDSFDALCAPVHLPPDGLIARADKEGKPVYTHHRMAGMIIRDTGRLNGMRSVEVTGTYGKTTTCTMLAGMLAASGERVLLHTSRGLFYQDALVREKLSITPANMIAALDISRDAGLKPSVCIFEVSLGGCGTADVGVITSLDRDYPIAGGTQRAYKAKMQMVDYAKPGSMLVHDCSVRRSSYIPVNTFGPDGDVYYLQDGHIRYNVRAYGGEISEGELLPVLAGNFDAASYRTPLLCATTVALTLGIDARDIISFLRGFDGIEGRMRTGIVQERMIVDNSNSGLSFEGIMRALDYSKGHPGRRILVIGEEKYNVCDGLDPGKASALIDSAGVDGIVLVGERLYAIKGEKYAYAPDLESGLDAALGMTRAGDTIISCVKTWR